MLIDHDLAMAVYCQLPSQRVFWYKFAPILVPLVRGGSKFATWRFGWDEPIPKVGDRVYLCVSPDREHLFGIGVVTEVFVKPFGALTSQDQAGHETFVSWLEMVATYESYYPQLAGKINEHTEVLVVKFKPIMFIFDGRWDSSVQPNAVVTVECDW